MFVVRFGELGHLLLHGRRHKVQIALAALDGSVSGEAHETSDRGLGRYYRTVFDDAAVLQSATATLREAD